MQIVIGLGGNSGEPPRAFRRALAELGARHRVVAVSSLYRTEPVGPAQPRFCNAAALLEVACPPLELLDRCHELERGAGRDRAREARWGPRPLDIDLLVASGVVYRGPRLELPHPHLHRRAFALVPAAELVPEWVHPILGRSIGELAADAARREPGAVLERRQLPGW